ncbi:hypothetical protein TNCV_1333241 [Trichonephila clavipes]|nr:hypothetical protein TNCV_1333241 [Trichonephila clavipes]
MCLKDISICFSRGIQESRNPHKQVVQEQLKEKNNKLFEELRKQEEEYLLDNTGQFMNGPAEGMTQRVFGVGVTGS